MFTRRTAIAMLPASLLFRPALANRNDCSPANSCDLPYSYRPDTPNGPDGAYKDISDRLSEYNIDDKVISSHYNASIKMISFINKLSDPKTRPVAMANLEHFTTLCQPEYVDRVLTLRKITEDEFDRAIDLDRRNRLMIDIGAANKYLSDSLKKYQPGNSDIQLKALSAKLCHDLRNTAKEALWKGWQLSRWGYDAFYAAARGYCAFQFITELLGPGNANKTQNEARVRAFILAILDESQSYLNRKANETVLPDQPLIRQTEYKAMAAMALGLREMIAVRSKDEWLDFRPTQSK